MVIRKVRIPSKVMLSGEYAVLYGATAALIPVPRHLELTEVDEPLKKPYPRVIEIALKSNIPETAAYEKKFGLPCVEIDDHGFFIEGKDGTMAKLGLGSSAAEAVAVVALRYKRAGLAFQQHKADILNNALKIHCEAQAGLGSGADISLCTYGQPIRFRNDKGDIRVELMKNEQPDNPIPLALVWSGKPADTRGLVRSFQRWVQKGGLKTKDMLSRLVEVSDELAKAWFSAPRHKLFDLLDEFDTAMGRCVESAGIAYKLAAHERFDKWAKGHGGRAKPTGAGGGDMILLVGELPLSELNELVIPIKLEDLFTDARRSQ